MRMMHFSGMAALALLMATAGGNAAAADSGEKIFQNSCAMCHQAQAQGMPGLAPPLKGSQWSKFAAARTYVPGVLLAGMNGSLPMESGNFVGVMPPQNRLSDDDIASVVNYLFGDVNAVAGWKAISSAEIATLRQATPAVSALKAQRKQALAK